MRRDEEEGTRRKEEEVRVGIEELRLQGKKRLMEMEQGLRLKEGLFDLEERGRALRGKGEELVQKDDEMLRVLRELKALDVDLNKILVPSHARGCCLAGDGNLETTAKDKKAGDSNSKFARISAMVHEALLEKNDGDDPPPPPHTQVV